MAGTQQEVEAYVATVRFPTTKEEIINGLLSREAPGRMVALVEHLPEPRYKSLELLLHDLAEVSQMHAREVAAARTYEDYLAVVLRHVGDVRHATKESFNRIVAHVLALAEHQGMLDDGAARRMQQRLEAAFADLRGTMSDVYDDAAALDPNDDLPTIGG
jgi:hypothetical protein